MASTLLQKLVPAWMREYRREQLGDDIGAGLIVAVLVIPQSLAYALLAGLPPQAGLYVSILPVMVYALLGSSRVQAVGPVAITAIMTFAVLSPFAAPASPQYIALAATLSLFSGLLVALFGLFRLGFLAQLLSRPVVSGFISGSAVLIVISQIKSLLGVTASGSGAWQNLRSLVEQLPQAEPFTAAIGLLSLLALYIARRGLNAGLLKIGLPARAAAFVVRLMPLLVIAAATLAVIFFDLDRRHGVRVVGAIEEGLGSFRLFLPEPEMLRQLAIPALTLAFIGTVQNITMAQALAVKRRERVEANRELVGLGAANLAAAFYGGMPVGGGLSRTAVNVAAGAQSPLASLVTAAAMFVIVAAGTHWLARLPLAALAACIVIAAIGMIDVKSLRLSWAYDRADALSLFGTALGVLLFGFEQGIALGVGLSLAALLYRASAPHIAVIGRIPGSEHFRNVARHGVETLPGAIFMRVDESLFFGNLNAIENRLAGELERAPETHDVVLVMSAVNRIDTTGMEALCELCDDLKRRGIRLHLAEVKGPVQDRLARSPLWPRLTESVHLSANRAYEALAPRAE